ncbi:MAG TPA: hypothetical protein PLB45_04725 [Bacilli bacterium]|jgi:signal peptidase I|nr:hypothetical protein [Bacilli bacterium]
MKKVLNVFKWIVIGIWFIFALTTTICLISYNDYKVTQMGKYSVIIVDNTDLEPTFNETDLLIVKKDSQKNYKVGDYIFFYNGNKTGTNYINYGEITDIQPDAEAEYAYFIGDTKVSYSDVIGLSNSTKIVKGWGIVLAIFESQWGFMFLVILPTLFALVYEIYSIVVEIKNNMKKVEE